MTDSNMIDFEEAWGNLNYEVDFVNPVGRSGEIVSIWDPLIFVKFHTFSSRKFSCYIRTMAWCSYGLVFLEALQL